MAWHWPARFTNSRPLVRSGGRALSASRHGEKRFPLPKDGHAVELRGEFYDLLNRPNFGNPISNPRSPAFGRTTRAGGSRVVQVALRYDF